MVRQSIALLLCVTLPLPGCAAAALSRGRSVPVQAAGRATDPVSMAQYVQKLPVGSWVRVDTVEGRTLRGTLMQTTDDHIVVQRNTRVAVAPESIRMSDVARVMLEPVSSSNGKLMAIGAAIGAGAAIGIVWLIAIIAFAD